MRTNDTRCYMALHGLARDSDADDAEPTTPAVELALRSWPAACRYALVKLSEAAPYIALAVISLHH